MSLIRIACLSRPEPTASTSDVLDLCHNYPRRYTQSGISGRVVCFGGQWLLMLEGPDDAVSSLLERILREVPEAGFEVRLRETADQRGFSSWSIGDVYLDEIAQADAAAGEALEERLVSLLSGDANADDDSDDEPTDPFADIAKLLEAFSQPRRALATADA